jgi:2'-5' RNA ligase
MRYGVYFIPDQSCYFYKIGSEIIGYDIRAGKNLNRNSQHADLPLIFHFDSAHFFGFHATIRGTFMTELPEYLNKKISALAAKTIPFQLENSFLHAFNQGNRSILFRPSELSSRHLFELHSEVVSLVDHCRVKGYISPETESIMPTLTDKELQILQRHGDPRILDGYIFHLTLANKATQEQLLKIDKFIKSVEDKLVGISITVDRICIVGQKDRDPYWRIIKEYIFGQTR